MNRQQLLIVTASLAALWLLASGALAASLAEFDLSWHVIVGGGGRSSSADYAMHGSVGQPSVGGLASADYRLSGGFWTCIGAQPAAATPTGGPSATSTATPSATPTGVPCENILPHGDFEAGLLPPWGAAGGTQVTTARAHGGARSARLGGINNAVDELFTAAELPPDATSITLSYWWYIESTDSDPGADVLLVVLGGAGGEVVIETFTNSSPRGAWHRATFDLSGYAGQPIGVTFHAETNGANPSSFYLDDVQIQVCGVPMPSQRVHLPIILRAARVS